MYGIYMVRVAAIFPALSLPSIPRDFHGYRGPVAVMDTGLEPWMRDYLSSYEGVEVLPLALIRSGTRFTDVRSHQSPVSRGNAFKAFGIVHYDLFDRFTWVDADLFVTCDPVAEVGPLLSEDAVVGTEDNSNTWTARDEEATGVTPGTYPQMNSGFVSLSAPGEPQAHE